MAEEAKWYVVHTYSGYENKVASDLRKKVDYRQLNDIIQDIRVPTEKVIEINDNKTREVERKIFPGYVLIKMVLKDDSWHVVKSIRGCTGFVGESTEPVPLDDEEVKNMGIETEKHIEVSYSEGDSVKVMAGPLKDFVGIVEKIDTDNGVVSVKLSMFGRETSATLDLSQVSPIKD